MYNNNNNGNHSSDDSINDDGGNDDEDIELLLHDNNNGTSVNSNSDDEATAAADADAGTNNTQKRLKLRRLLAQAKPERGILIVATIGLLISAASTLAIPMYIGRILDALNGSGSEEGDDHAEEQLRNAVLALLIVAVISAVSTFARAALFTLAGERVVARLRVKLFRRIMAQEVGMYDVTKCGELTNRLSSDTALLKNAVTVNISMALRWSVSAFGACIYLFILSWQLTLIMLSVVPVVAVGGRRYGMYVRKLAKQTQEALAASSDVAQESFSSVRTVRSFGKESSHVHMYQERIDETFRMGRKMAYAYGSFIATMSSVGMCATILVLYCGGRLVLDGRMSSGVLTSFMLYTITLGASLAGLSGVWGTFMSAMGANERVFQLLDRVPAINTTDGVIPQFQRRGGLLIACDHVSFAYPSRSKQVVVRDFHYTFEPTSITALVGISGGGKSTIVSLLSRFYDPSEGNIYVNNVNLRDIDPLWLHKHVALVAQEPVLFASTIRDNICYGCPEADDERVIQASRDANAHAFIQSFPDGYDTMVGEKGVRLSGGQKQRIAIARALLMNPSVLLLDEATSALDAESQHLVQEALDRIFMAREVKRTIIVIAHRLSTVKMADTVVVLHNGRIVEQGSHAQLLRDPDGEYARLVHRELAINDKFG